MTRISLSTTNTSLCDTFTVEIFPGVLSEPFSDIELLISTHTFCSPVPAVPRPSLLELSVASSFLLRSDFTIPTLISDTFIAFSTSILVKYDSGNNLDEVVSRSADLKYGNVSTTLCVALNMCRNRRVMQSSAQILLPRKKQAVAAVGMSR